jgi:hypothetical protein
MAGRNKDSRRRQRSPSPDTEDELDFGHIQCFVPSTSIDVAVLAKYLREFIDDTVTIRASTNPSVGKPLSID